MGDIFAWVNSDDVYLPGALAKVRQRWTANPQWDIVTGGHVRLMGFLVAFAHRLGGESAGRRGGEFSSLSTDGFFFAGRFMKK